MTHLIDKSVLVAEIEKRRDSLYSLSESCEKGTPAKAGFYAQAQTLEGILSFLNTLEVKEVEDNSLEKFKSLQHITRDLHKTLVEDWGYAPNLYHFDKSWHVDWISCEEGDSIKDFTGGTAEAAIEKAYNWFHSTFCNS